VLGAIIAFGPAFSFPLIGAMGGKEPMHANFATRVADRLAKVQLTPLAMLQGITGLLLIYFGNIDLFKSTWLLIAIVLYLIAILFAIFVQARNAEHMVELTKNLQGPPSAEVGAEIAATGKALQRGGMLLTVLILLIVLIMVTKPQF
jgi:uncharacterized membrane protein